MKLFTLLFSSLLGLLVAAQNDDNTQKQVTILAGGQGYAYHGCYTETTDLFVNTTSRRALDGGSNSVQPDIMTVEKCWEFCGKGSYKYAGLEYSRCVVSLAHFHSCGVTDMCVTENAGAPKPCQPSPRRSPTRNATSPATATAPSPAAGASS